MRRPQHLGIIAAMDEEFSLIAAAFGGGSTKKIGPREFLSASHDGVKLTLVCSRIGKVAAASTATLLLHEFGCDALLFTGVAGGIDPAVGVGDIVAADALVQHDMDPKGVLGYKRFEIPLLGGPRLEARGHLAGIANEAARVVVADPLYQSAVSEFCQRQPAHHTGVIASGDVFVCSHEEREDLRTSIPSLKCVEMEGAAVAQVCVEHGVPFSVVRIISDSADSGAHIDFPRFIQSAAAVGSEMLVREFVRRMAEMPLDRGPSRSA